MKYKNHICIPKLSEGDGVYFGYIDGRRNMPMIEAKTLDDFERLFQEEVDSFDKENGLVSPAHRKWTSFVTAAIVIGLLAVLVLTCPKKEQHVNTIIDSIKTSLVEEEKDDDLAVLSALFGGFVAKTVIDNVLSVDNYFIFSLGKIKYQGESITCSVGFLGHVFTKSGKQIRESVDMNSFE